MEIKIHRYPPKNPRCKQCGSPKHQVFNGGRGGWATDCPKTCPLEIAEAAETEAFMERVKKRFSGAEFDPEGGNL